MNNVCVEGMLNAGAISVVVMIVLAFAASLVAPFPRKDQKSSMLRWLAAAALTVLASVGGYIVSFIILRPSGCFTENSSLSGYIQFLENSTVFLIGTVVLFLLIKSGIFWLRKRNHTKKANE